jgi:hypothetical protein
MFFILLFSIPFFIWVIARFGIQGNRNPLPLPPPQYEEIVIYPQDWSNTPRL